MLADRWREDTSSLNSKFDENLDFGDNKSCPSFEFSFLSLDNDAFVSDGEFKGDVKFEDLYSSSFFFFNFFIFYNYI